MAKIKIPSFLASITVEQHVKWMSPWELERIHKYVEKHPKAERLPLSLLRRQAKLYWFVENLKHNKKGHTNE